MEFNKYGDSLDQFVYGPLLVWSIFSSVVIGFERELSTPRVKNKLVKSVVNC